MIHLKTFERQQNIAFLMLIHVSTVMVYVMILLLVNFTFNVPIEVVPSNWTYVKFYHHI